MAGTDNDLDVLIHGVKKYVENITGNQINIRTVAEVIKNVNAYIVSQHMVPVNVSIESLNNFEDKPPAVSDYKKPSEVHLGAIDDLIDNCIPRDQIAPDAKASLMTQIATIACGRYKSWSAYRARSSDVQAIAQPVVSAEGMAYIATEQMSVENFGVNSDIIASDIRATIAVAILKSIRSNTERMFKPIATKDIFIQGHRENTTVYDLSKAASTNQADRDFSNHVPLIELYRRPEIVDGTTSPIIVKAANDPTFSWLLSPVDGSPLKVGVVCSLWDLDRDSSVPGGGSINQTDLLGEGAKITELVLEATYTPAVGAPIVETFKVDTTPYAGMAFVPMTNAPTSLARAANGTVPWIMRNTTTQYDGSASAIAALPDLAAHGIQVFLSVSANLVLDKGQVSAQVMSAKAPRVVNTNSKTIPPTGAATATAALIKWKVIGFQHDVKRSEENLRKSSLAAKTVVAPWGMEIPPSRVVQASSSHQQGDGSSMLSTLSMITSIADDTRQITILNGHLSQVAAAVEREDAMVGVSYEQNLNGQYLAGGICNPYVITERIDFDAIINMRESELATDITARMRLNMHGLFAKLLQRSQYRQNLTPGEQPVMKMLIWGPILDTITINPQYHPSLAQFENGKEGRNAHGADWSMMLHSGVRIDFYATSWERLKDKALGFMMRDGASAEEVTNFARYYDAGAFTGSYVPTVDTATYRQLFTTQRRIVLVTNPVGFELTFVNYADYFPQLTAA